MQDLVPHVRKSGKPEKVARIAAARKLLLMAQAIYGDGEFYTG